ncbi:MAG: FAD-dependent oxidoreductase [Pseudomonadota bacterium]
MAYDVDLFVIGGGSGGVRAARTSASTGARVALAEDSRMGGTCVIRGCVPKKLMVFASEFRETVNLAADYGWSASAGNFDWTSFSTKLNSELDRLEQVYRNLLKQSGVTIHDARAKVSGPHEVTLSTGETITAAHILIATGGRPVRPDQPNAHLGLVSDDIFSLPKLPKSILIIGGGYIACEFACILNGLGVEVTQYYRGAQVLRGFDDEARGLVAEMMRERGVNLHLGTSIVEAMPVDEHTDEAQPSASDAAMGAPAGVAVAERSDAKKGTPIWVKASNGDTQTFDYVFFATGRTPNSRDIGLEEVGVKLNRRGAVEVDEYSKTAVDSIYAIGDVTDRIQLTPVAIREGMAFTETVFKNNPTAVDHDLVASAVFTQPELGTVGLTEEQARDQEAIDVYCTSFRPMRTAFADKPDRVLMKLVVSKETRKVLGCQIVAPEAGELIQMVGIAVKAGLTKEDFDRTVAVHPTMSEELVTMQNPVRSA